MEKLLDKSITTYWNKQPLEDCIHVVVRRPDSTSPLEIQLRILCARYWGKGDDGRKVIYQEAEITIPPVDESDDEDTDLASGSNGPATGTFTYKFKCASLGPGFESFFGTNATGMLIREEYYGVMDCLRHLFDRQLRGAVVLGQPGIGKNLNYPRQS
jgi:hypothetical protein